MTPPSRNSKCADAARDLLQHEIVLKSSHRQTWIVCLLLAVIVWAAYWPALHCDFVQFDDPDYILTNRTIQHGLNWPMVVWAFSTTHAENWHPLTWLSHALDVQLFGLAAAGHHATSIFWHMANSILLFLVLRQMTGAPRRDTTQMAKDAPGK